MRSSFTFLLLVIATWLPAQRAQWIAHTDCGNLINVRHISADGSGNLYVGGEFKGEAAYGSALNDTVITKYTSEHSQKSFLVRYNADGVPTFVVQFKGSSTYIQAVKALPSGECLVFVQGSLDFVDPHGNHIKAGKSGNYDNFFCVRADGSLKWSRAINADNVSFLETAGDGTIYLSGTWGRSYAQDVFLLTLSGDGLPRDTLRFKDKTLNAMQVNGNQLLLCVSFPNARRWSDPKTLSPFDIAPDHFAVYTMDRATLQLKKLFEKECPMREGIEQKTVASFRVTFNNTSGSLWTDFVIPTDYNATLFMDKRYTRTGGNTHIVRLNAKGEQVIDRAFDCLQYNTVLIPLDNGCSALMVAAYGSAFHYGNDSIALPERRMFINELVIAKLDHNLNKVWWITAGATASNYHTSKPFYEGSGRFYVASDLLDSSTIFGSKQELIWHSAMYVMRFSE